MSANNRSSLPDVIELFSKHYSKSENDDSPLKPQLVHSESEDDLSDLDELEVFADHLLLGRRLRKRLYAGDLKELPDHPPIALTGLALELFSKAAPNYGLDVLDMDYVTSASEAARISPCAMILAMIYLERLQLTKSEYLETASPTGLFVVTMLVASKFLFEDEDDIVTNQTWAEALNLDVKDVNHMEYEFLSAIDWKIFIDSSNYFRYLSNIEKVIAFRQSKQRGWLSYSDIYVLAQHSIFQGFWSCLFERLTKITLLWALGYVATAMTLHSFQVALLTYVKPVKNISQNITTDTTMQFPTIPTSIQPIDNPSELQVNIPEIVMLSFTSFGVDEKQTEQWLCRDEKTAQSDFDNGQQPVFFASKNYSIYLTYHRDIIKIPNNDVASYNTWNMSQHVWHRPCIVW